MHSASESHASGTKEMEHHQLGFGDINILQGNIAEVVFHEGIELDLPMVREYHNFLLRHMQYPFGVMVNKRNSYTYTFEAQLNIDSMHEVKAIAFVSHSEITQISAECIADMPRNIAWNYKIFTDRAEALEWLSSELGY